MEDLDDLRSGHLAGWAVGGFAALVGWGMLGVGVYGTISDHLAGARGNGVLIPPVLGVIGLVLGPLLTRSVLGSLRTWRAWGDLRARGVPATATFVTRRRSNTRLNRRRLWHIRLAVRGPDGAPREAEIGWPVPSEIGAHLVPGAHVAVLVDPADPTNLVIDWPATRRLWGF